MAQTGIDVRTGDSGIPSTIRKDVNSNSALVFSYNSRSGTRELPHGKMVQVRSVEEFAGRYGHIKAGEEDRGYSYTHVSRYFERAPGTLLWVGTMYATQISSESVYTMLLQTIANGYEHRPRQIGFVDTQQTVPSPLLGDALSLLHSDGISAVGVAGCTSIIEVPGEPPSFSDAVNGNINYPLLSSTPKVGVVIAGLVPDAIHPGGGTENCAIGFVLGDVASTPVETSIGDPKLRSVAGPDSGIVPGDWGIVVYDTGVYPPRSRVAAGFASASPYEVERLSKVQLIFPRTRPPKSGMWWNDGATAADPSTGLNTIEMQRTLAAIIDELRLFFTGYLNKRIPVNASGDIDSSFKATVLDSAKSRILQRFLGGGLSDARLSLQAKDNNMVATRAWQITLEVLPTATLQWVKGYVFYVKSL